MNVNQYSPTGDKIGLFRSLFRGREDVYPRRFENRKTGRSGYVFACAHEWVRGICEKPKIKCSECPHRRFLPVTDDIIRWHLSGVDNTGRDFVMGLYPMLLDETCFFLVADFDKASWQEDAMEFLTTCRMICLPAALERSRSGKGAHIWLFFEEAISASLARKLGAYLLTETMERRPEIGLDSYDRFFPNQDTLPQGGLGNLIALPLQKKARDKGNSLFVDDTLIPWEDQWAFLSQVQRIGRDTVEEIVYKADAKDRIVGVRLFPSDEDNPQPWKKQASRLHVDTDIKNLEIVLANEIYIAKEGLPAGLKNRLIRLAAFQNPEFYKAQAMRLPTYDIPRIIACTRDHGQHIGLPRGSLEELCQLFAELKIKPIIRDERYPGKTIEVQFTGELRLEQRAAAEKMLSTDTGVLSATTAFGKTVIGAWLIAERKVNTLVLVHRRQLQEQWVERLASFLNLPREAIGRIGGGRKKPKGVVDVALIQSLMQKGDGDDLVSQYGHILVDECHHVSAVSFEEVARRAKAKFITGLSATVTRKDGHHPIIWMQCGPVRYRVNAKEQAARRPFQHVVLVRPTAFYPSRPANADARFQFHDLYEDLIKDEERNRVICDDVSRAVEAGRSPIVLTERNEHLECLSRQLTPHIPNVIVLRGGMKKQELAEATVRLTSLAEQEPCVLIATGKFIGEGFDNARLDTLFLTLPISWRGTIAQYAGRLHRFHDRKKEVQVYDYADLNVPMLSRMFNRRCKGYEAIGYKILLPASAIPGWPADVPLPVDPAWKIDYAASVRRLVLDGVDRPLANLFVQVSTGIAIDAEGLARARSATEAFLYRRLETLPQTAGRFRLNFELAIPFDGWGRMEVDLLCADAHLAIEIDGKQHLGDIDAYRRDRRKDVLLQENGYRVLRFLAEDVGKRLDDVLDTILRALAHERI